MKRYLKFAYDHPVAAVAVISLLGITTALVIYFSYRQSTCLSTRQDYQGTFPTIEHNESNR